MSIYVGIDVGKLFHVAYCLDERGSILTSIPGVGPVTAATIISEIGDIAQFRSSDALVCYC